MKTEIVFLLDRSGSMAGKEAATVHGYNSFIAKHAAEDCLVTTVLFDDQYELLYNGLPAAYASILPEQYWVRGSTALYDAVGRAITAVGKRHARMKGAERPHTYLVITTDGFENASHEYSAEKLRAILNRQQEKHGWEIFFIGCDMDSALARRSAAAMGAPAQNVLHCSSNSDDYFDNILNMLNNWIHK